MNIKKVTPSFRGLNVSKLNAIDAMSVDNIERYRNLAENYDVSLKSTKKDFPYRKSSMTVNAIKISARPKNLGFWDKLLGRKTVIEYFPTRMRELIEYKKCFAQVFKETIAKVKL